MIPADWQKIPMPMGLTVAVLSLGYGIWIGLHVEFVSAQVYRWDKKTTETRSLERDKKVVENEVLRLQLKQEFYPEKFDAIDKALHKKQSQDLAEIQADLKEVGAQK